MSMRVLLAVEGSKFSEAALEKCCELFRKSDGTEIMILAAAEPVYVGAEPFVMSAEYIADAEASVVEASKRTVSAAEQEIRREIPDIGDRLTTEIIKARPAQGIVEEAKDWGADLIVMGSHGYGFWQRTFLGSVSNAVVHHAPCSVLIVRPKLNGISAE